MITEQEARRIASEWHGGQASPLYAFSSSGTIVKGLLVEINDCLTFDIAIAKYEGDPLVRQAEKELHDLRRYIESRKDD